MLKLSIKNPTTQETETYDVVTEFNQFFNQAKEYGLINSIFSLRVNAMKDENAPIRLHADSDVGNGLLSILDGDDSLYDVRVIDEEISDVPEEHRGQQIVHPPHFICRVPTAIRQVRRCVRRFGKRSPRQAGGASLRGVQRL